MPDISRRTVLGATATTAAAALLGTAGTAHAAETAETPASTSDTAQQVTTQETQSPMSSTTETQKYTVSVNAEGDSVAAGTFTADVAPGDLWAYADAVVARFQKSNPGLELYVTVQRYDQVVTDVPRP
ncbi:hypothetical protein [Actinacidiphila yeochonensis]|uniref:hypothetical protein n=1 Tax=Actinacidiphila yeochonensis TaxID=89050 RepID=UPI00056AF981|nr:hypothetical protein [Actinacidiphila yeochonensis]